MKRSFDIILALIASLILILPFIIITIIVRLTSKGPAIFWTKRVGKNNDLFDMPKFRSMYIETPEVATHLLKDSQSYITPVGKILRKTSLDEIPQLYSVLKGDMSFVGPRPALYNQDDLIELRTKNSVHTILPGVTGWAQINGRDEISIPAKVELDTYYLKNRSIIFDIKIIFLTFFSVLFSKNISH